MHKSFCIQDSTPLMGSASVSPQDPVIAGSTGTWTFTYRAGVYGMEDSGALRLAWRMVSDWEVPQTTDPKGYAYTTIHTTAEGCVFQAQYDRYIRPFTNSLLIRLVRGSLKEGDEVTIVWGDTSEGGPGARAQSYQEKNHEFMLQVDTTGSGVFRLVEKPIRLDVIAGAPYRLQTVLPGTVQPGKPFAVTVRCLDNLGNPAPSYKGMVDLSVAEWDQELHTIPEKVSFADCKTGVMRIENCTVSREGAFHLKASDEMAALQAISNPCISREDGNSLYWADMHGQNADTLGSGSLDEYYTFSRDVAAVDVTGWQGNDFEITDQVWERVQDRTAAYHEEGRFLPFLGYEWSGCTPRGGDYNIFYLNDREPFYPSSDWLSEGEIDFSRVTTPISNLWNRFRGRDDVLAIPHVGGRAGNLSFIEEGITPAVEVHSHHGTFDWFALEAMSRRKKVGFVGSSDDHTCRVGMFLPCAGKTPSGGFDVASGFTGIWASALTKEAVWQAIRARHCYASTFTRIYAEAVIGTAMMGDEVQITSQENYRVHVVGALPVERICIYNWERQIADLPARKAEKDRILVRWKGVIPGGKHKSTRWDGCLEVKNSEILDAQEYAIDREDQGIRVDWTCGRISFVSTSSGDYEGMILHLSEAEKAVLEFRSEQGSCEICAAELNEHPTEIALNANCSVEFLLTAAPIRDEKKWYEACEITVEYPVPVPSESTAWWAKVILENGDAAWISPIFVEAGE